MRNMRLVIYTIYIYNDALHYYYRVRKTNIMNIIQVDVII